MIEPLQDAHTGVEAMDVKKDFDGWLKDSNHLEVEDWKRAQQLIANRYLRGRLRRFCNGRVEFGMLDHSIGYLRITAFYGYAGEDSYVRAQEALRLALDDIFRNSNKLNEVVIDVRLNHGGDDQLGIEIASRLTDRRYLAYAKAARNNLAGPLHFTAAEETWVVPSKRPSFHGDIVLLIGPDTVSAVETFTMALLGREPQVSRIGLNTQGVFSDVLNRSLPNGWRFRLPNEVYRTSDGTTFDGLGVPPDIRAPFFSREDLGDPRDAVLEKANDILWRSPRRDEP
jgi:C-terminal processing protease CtpA/Prc